MAKTNYQFAKRARELEKKRKREEKIERRKNAAERGESGPATIAIDEFGNPIVPSDEDESLADGDDGDDGDDAGPEANA
jgi:hypothetical protein